MKNNKIVIISIVIALIALLIIMISLSFLILNQKNKKANAENLINPFASRGVEKQGESIINILDGDRDSNTNDENMNDGYPHITLSNISFDENTNYLIDLDNYVTDSDYSKSELNWTVSGNQNISIIIDNSTHIANFSAPLNWNGYEEVIFRVTDPEGLYDEETITVTVNSVDNDLTWNTLSDKAINEDSPNGTIIYQNITGEVNSSISFTITAQPNQHFNLLISGNDLIINNLEKDWYGMEAVVLNANGVQASFTLTINQILDDCVIVHFYGTDYRYCD